MKLVKPGAVRRIGEVLLAVAALGLSARQAQASYCWQRGEHLANTPRPWVTGCFEGDFLHAPGSTGGQTVREEHRNWHCGNRIPMRNATDATKQSYGRAFLAFHRQFILDYDNVRLDALGFDRLESWDPYQSAPVPGDDETASTAFTHCSGLGSRLAHAGCTTCQNLPPQFLGTTLGDFETLGDVGFDLEVSWHASFHNGVGLLGCNDIMTFLGAPNDPAFWMAHKKLDEVSRDWQRLKATDVVIVVDRSGSMIDNCSSASPPAAESPCALNDAREAARLFGNVVLDTRLKGGVPAPRQHRVGLVSFGSTATTLLGLTPADQLITDNNLDDTPFETALAGIAATDYTSIAAGIREAISVLHAVPDPNLHQAILVLSDGKENKPPCLEGATDPCRSSDVLTEDEVGSIQIVSIGFGEGAQELNLRVVAERHGGVFVAQENVDDPLSLEKFFVTAFGEIFDTAVSVDPRGTLPSGQTASDPVPIAVCDDEHLSVVLGRSVLPSEIRTCVGGPDDGTPCTSDPECPGGLCVGGGTCDLALELRTPSGQLVNRLDAGVEGGHGPRHDFLHVELPYAGESTGTWHARVVRTAGSAPGCASQEYFYSVLARGVGRVEPFVARPAVTVGQQLLATFRITESNRPAGGFDAASGSVTLTRPDGSTETHPLYDDGTNGDAVEDNSVWSVEIPTPALQSGVHHFRGHFELTENGCTRVRESEYSIYVVPEPDPCTRLTCGGVIRLRPGKTKLLEEQPCVFNGCAPTDQYSLEVTDSLGWLNTWDSLSSSFIPLPPNFQSGLVPGFESQCFGEGPDEGNPGGTIPLYAVVPPGAAPGDVSTVVVRVTPLAHPSQPIAECTTTIEVLPPPDCNRNGVDDAVDIANATSADLDGNEVPDECGAMFHWPRTYGVAGKKLRIRDRGSDGRKVVIVSRDTAFDTSPAAFNPFHEGAYLHVYSGTDSACFFLPAASWTAAGAGRVLKYRGGPSAPCQLVLVKHGTLLKAICGGAPIPLTLDEATQGQVTVRLTSAHDHDPSAEMSYCGVFGGTIGRDRPGLFTARNSPRPEVCPWAPLRCP